MPAAPYAQSSKPIQCSPVASGRVATKKQAGTCRPPVQRRPARSSHTSYPPPSQPPRLVGLFRAGCEHAPDGGKEGLGGGRGVRTTDNEER